MAYIFSCISPQRSIYNIYAVLCILIHFYLPVFQLQDDTGLIINAQTCLLQPQIILSKHILKIQGCLAFVIHKTGTEWAIGPAVTRGNSLQTPRTFTASHWYKYLNVAEGK